MRLIIYVSNNPNNLHKEIKNKFAHVLGFHKKYASDMPKNVFQYL